MCATGRAGPACDTCAIGFIQSNTSGLCVYLTGGQSGCSDGVKDGEEEGIDCGGPSCAPCATGTSVMPLTVWIIVGMATVTVVVIACLLLRAWQRRSQRQSHTSGCCCLCGRHRNKLAPAPRTPRVAPKRVTLVKGKSTIEGHDRVTPLYPVPVQEWTPRGGNPRNRSSFS